MITENVEVAAADDARIMELIAVLSAMRIGYQLAQKDSFWRLIVAESDVEAARNEIAAYEEDERQRLSRARAISEPDRRMPPSWSPAWVSLFLLGMYLWLGPYDAENTLLRRAASDPDALLRLGEWWRAVTALTVHGGEAHLAGNIIALFFFGREVCRLFGGGLGWLIILSAGIAGNILACAFQKSLVVSFGASTACFGALGVITAHQAVLQARRHGLSLSVWSRAWVPLGAGFALLTFLGTGPRSNLTAHLTGFFCGCALGLPCSMLKIDAVPSWVQHCLQAICLTVIILAWWMAGKI